jgi:hypothetical protein
MSRFHRNSMNVDGIPMSYDLIDCFREAGAVDFYREIISQSRYDMCFSRNVLSEDNYAFLVRAVNQNLELYRAMLRFYIHKDTSSVHSALITILARFDPGDLITKYLLHFNELVLCYPTKARGVALKRIIDLDLERFNQFFPHVSNLYMAQMLREFELEL